MKHCIECGAKLITKHLEGEGEIPFCPACGQFRFPIFNAAVIMIVVDKSTDRILLIKQYGRDSYILVAGYISKGENAESAVVREIKEETGLDAVEIHFNRSKYFEPSNTLMFNFTAYVENADKMIKTDEVDSYEWFSFAEARKNIKEGSLAKEFLCKWLDDQAK